MIALAFLLVSASSEASLETIRRYKAPEARQAVAVDRTHFYAITNSKIGKYEKATGKPVATWSDETGAIKHLNSGVVVKGKLYCSNSNYPEIPMQGSIEIFDTTSLKHMGSHSFGIGLGSPTWIDWRDNAWWVVFGHYNGKGGEPGRTNDQTQLVKFDKEFRRMASWTFPTQVISQWDGMTSSGGFWHPSGVLVTTGHHFTSLYLVRLPKAGSVLEFVSEIKMEAEGQGIALDPVDSSLVYSIQRKTGEVLVGRLPK